MTYNVFGRTLNPTPLELTFPQITLPNPPIFISLECISGFLLHLAPFSILATF